MPKKQNQNQKRGYKGPMRRATKQVQKVLALAEKRRRQALKGNRVPQKGKHGERIPNYPSRDTNQVKENSKPAPASEKITTMEDFRSAKPMLIPGAMLTAGLSANALGSGVMRRGSSARNPNPGIGPEVGGPPGGYRLPPQGSGNDRKLNNPSFGNEVNVFKAPVVIGIQSHGHNPKMWAKARKGDVEVVVEHVEYLKDVISSGSSDFLGGELMAIDVNPGLSTFAPWLSTLAANFDEYKFDYVELRYEPACGTSSDGKILATFDPDVLDELPDSKQEMLEARVQLDSPVWTRASLKVPKDLLSNYLYVRSASVPANADQHVYDVGQFILNNIGAAASPTVLGELFMCYKVRLRTPNGGIVKEGNILANSTSVAAPLGTSFTATDASTLQLTWITGTTFYFQTPGIYAVHIVQAGTGFTGGATLSANGSVNTVTSLASAFTAGIADQLYEIEVADEEDYFTLTAPGGAATLSSTRIRLWPHDIDN